MRKTETLRGLLVTAAVAALLAGVLASPVAAQAPTGNVYGTVTDAAVLAFQDRAHCDWRCTGLRFEELLMAIAAIQPLCVRLMRKYHDRGAAALVQEDVALEKLHWFVVLE